MLASFRKLIWIDVPGSGRWLSGRKPERPRKVNCRALKNKAYGIRFLTHGRHALPGIGMDPLVPTSARLSFHQRKHPSQRRFRSCPSQLQRNSGSEAAVTVDYIGPSRTNGYSIMRKRAVILPILDTTPKRRLTTVR